jgi:hypothetical protein
MFKLSFSKKTSFAIKTGISFLFIAWLVYKVKWGSVWENVRHMQLNYLLWYVVFVLLGMLVSAKKWQFIARFKGFQRTVFGCFRAYLTGTFINNFLPGFIGGDMFRAYWLGKQRDGYTPAISTVIFDRLSGLFAATVLAVAFSLMRFHTVIQSSVWTLFVVMLIILIIGVVFWGTVWKYVNDNTIVQSIVRALPRKLQIFLNEVRNYFREDILFPAIGFSLVFNMLGVGIANLLLFQAFGQTIPVMDFFAVIFLVNIISSVPISVNNIGIKEWAYFTFFTLIHINPEVAITVAIVGRFMQMLLSFFALPDFLHRKRIVTEV